MMINFEGGERTMSWKDLLKKTKSQQGRSFDQKAVLHEVLDAAKEAGIKEIKQTALIRILDAFLIENGVAPYGSRGGFLRLVRVFTKAEFKGWTIIMSDNGNPVGFRQDAAPKGVKTDNKGK